MRTLDPTTRPQPAVTGERGDATTPPQHPLWTSILLHLFPGAALTVFVLAAAPVVERLGFPAVFALFLGIPLVIVPLELGYLLWHAKRTTGSFRLRAATIAYRRRLPRRQLVAWSAALFVWFAVWFALSSAFLDVWLAERFFAWMPETLLQFAAVGAADGGTGGTTVLVILVVVAFVGNGVLGPIVEELYFRGHLLPRLERFGRWAPVLNTVLFSLYHLWTPWQNPARIVGFLPIAWGAWRHRSVQLPMVAHVTINLLFLLSLVAVVAGAAA